MRMPKSLLPLTSVRRKGVTLALGSAELQQSVAEKFGSAVELMNLKHGIFDEASVSVIHQQTISKSRVKPDTILTADVFWPNIVIAGEALNHFFEDGWIGGRLVFGSNEGPMVSLTLRDLRCVMINPIQTRPRRILRDEDRRASERQQCRSLWNGSSHGPNQRVGQSVSLIVDQ